MVWNRFIYILICLAVSAEAKEIHIPLCAAWNSTGTVLAGLGNGAMGSDEMSLNQPTAVIIDENDTMYVVDSLNNRLMKYESGSRIGQPLNISLNTTGEELLNPQDMVLDLSGIIYVSEAGGNRVVNWTLDSQEINVVVDVLSPFGIHLDETTDNLYVIAGGPYPFVMRYGLTTLEDVKVAGDGFRGPLGIRLYNLYGPVGIYVDSRQNLFVAESESHRITKWGPGSNEGQIVAGAGDGLYGATLTLLNSPTSIILDDANIMYITDSGNNRIIRWTLDSPQGECILGCPVESNDTIIDQLIHPYDATFDSKHNLIVVEKNMHRVRRFDFYFELSCMLKYCSPPNIYIQDHKSNNTRNQSMTFFIYATLLCHIWLTTDMTCTVTACFPGDKSCTESTQLDVIVNTFLVSNSFNMRIPPLGLPVGTFDFSCTITMTLTGLNSSIDTNLQIIRSPVLITLLPFGKSGITLGYQQEFTFRPTVSSSDSDESYRQDMHFVYYCRKYPEFDYPMGNGTRLSIDDDSKNPKNTSCFDRTEAFLYDNTIRSSLTITSRSLQVNRTYEFYVVMHNHEGLVDKSDTVLVRIQSQDSFIIKISPKFNTLTLSNDYQLLNPSTQIVLESSCDPSCPNALITWKIYKSTQTNNSIIKWEEYRQIKQYINNWFYGINSTSVTATQKLFSSNKNVNYWQFEAIYTDVNLHGSGLIQFKINHPPLKKTCSINPIKGSTSQTFTITCARWTDLDGIKDYFLYVVNSKLDIEMSIAHSVERVFKVYLPSGDPKLDYRLKLVVHVRDMLNAWTESNIMEIKIAPNEQVVTEMLNFTENNYIVIKDLLLNGDKNQLINSFSTILNQMALHDQETLMNNSQMQISELIISTFDTIRAEMSSNVTDLHAAKIFIENLGRRANIREYLLNFYKADSVPETIEKMIILSSTISQLTETASEWSRTSLTLASHICNQLATAVNTISRKITYEQITLVADSVAQCASNVFTGVNAPLQGRGQLLDHNINKTLTSPDGTKPSNEYYTDYELDEVVIRNCNHSRIKFDELCKEIISDSNNLTAEIFHQNYDFYNQQLLANTLRAEIDETIFLIGKSVRRHLNIHQKFPISYPALRMIVEQIYRNDIENKSIDLYTRNALIYLPTNLTFSESNQIGLRTTLLPLAPAGGNPNVRLSTALSISVLDDDDKLLEITATNEIPIEMFIPRDINLPIPIFLLQDMTKLIPPKRGTFKNNRQFFIYYINITQINPNLTVSIHLDLKPLNTEMSYGIIVKLDAVPSYNSTHNFTDRWTMFCSTDLINTTDYYTYYVDNMQTAGHKSLFVGIRELPVEESCLADILPTITDEPYSFLSNYTLRVYGSGCYYLDEKSRWKSDGLKVGAKTNLDYTHCYSNHI